MCNKLQTLPDWTKDSGEKASEHAEKGGIALAAKVYPMHGHIAVVFPKGSLAWSGSWGKLVPFVANVGKRNGVMKTSEAFPVLEGQPEYWLYKAE